MKISKTLNADEATITEIIWDNGDIMIETTFQNDKFGEVQLLVSNYQLQQIIDFLQEENLLTINTEIKV